MLLLAVQTLDVGSGWLPCAPPKEKRSNRSAVAVLLGTKGLYRVTSSAYAYVRTYVRSRDVNCWAGARARQPNLFSDAKPPSHLDLAKVPPPIDLNIAALIKTRAIITESVVTNRHACGVLKGFAECSCRPQSSMPSYIYEEKLDVC